MRKKKRRMKKVVQLNRPQREEQRERDREREREREIRPRKMPR